MTIVHESSRLIFRLFTMEDAALVYELNRDENVTRFTYDPISDMARAADVLQRTIIPQYVLYNYGRWATHLKEDMSFIGWCGLKFRAELKEVDLGYRFMEKYWGQGYATEAAFAAVKYGFEKLHIPRITGRADPKNLASARVLEKIGMKFIGQEQVDGHSALVYEAINPLIT
jgi:ribosomal-protein-alanine N-acetyltransferase